MNDLFQKTSTKSGAKYTACAQSSPRVTPYSGLGQLLDTGEDNHVADQLPPPSLNNDATEYTVYTRLGIQSTPPRSTNQSDCDSSEAPLSHRSSTASPSSSDHVINMEEFRLRPPYLDQDPQPQGPDIPECYVTCRRKKTAFEARVRLAMHDKPIYVGRYKTEQAARDACARLLRQTTPRQESKATK
ncbi:hypothetical protein DYB38_011955 [Aphanomyces astaci]|uniref:Uncharacterized protein n=1 Tax=Aphanomyces astaci TaxID=112090 RepID=A0A397DRG9_APHAT|nr:hypothetical protein DYB38_011955 [Aphanomyces astaci]